MSQVDDLIDVGIGCARGRGIACSEYPWVACCQTRLRIAKALNLGEPVETDYLPDEGWIHLFEKRRRRQPLLSAGGVRMVGFDE